MVHWGWLVVAAVVSCILTIFLFCLVVINKDNPEYLNEE